MVVGQEQTSNNNVYFHVIIQLAEKEKSKVRVMKSDTALREVFLANFENVSCSLDYFKEIYRNVKILTF